MPSAKEKLRLRQRTTIQDCVKNKFSVADTIKFLRTAYGDLIMATSRVYEWYKRFKSGRKTETDDPKCGRPRTARTQTNAERIEAEIMRDRSISVRELSAMFDLSIGTGPLFNMVGTTLRALRSDSCNYIMDIFEKYE